MARRLKKINLSHQERIDALKLIGTLCLLDQPQWGAKSLISGMGEYSDLLPMFDALILALNKKANRVIGDLEVLEVVKKLEGLYRERVLKGSEVDQAIRDLAKSYNPTISESSLDTLCKPLNDGVVKGPADNAKDRIKLIFPRRNSSRVKIWNQNAEISKLRQIAKENLAWNGINEPLVAPLLLFFEMSNLNVRDMGKILSFMHREGFIQGPITLPEECS